MKASMQLIEKLRAQMPPEASKQLDELEGMLGEDMMEEGDEMSADAMADEEAPAEDEEAPMDEMAADEEEELAPAAAPAKKKKPSFFQ